MPSRERRRTRHAAALLLTTAALLCGLYVAAPASNGEAGGASPGETAQPRPTNGSPGTPPAIAPAPPPLAAPPGQPTYAVGVTTISLVDTSRRVRLPDGREEPRTLDTVVRYPALGAPGTRDTRGAEPARANGPYPLLVFAHGFAVTPATYARLLHSWAQAGFVVAAPAFPLENADAPGGPDESDLVNEPADISFVISRLFASNAAPTTPAAPLSGLIDPAAVALAGQSDGGEAALAAAYSRRDRDARVDAAMILSGAEMGGVGGYAFKPGSPALLAVQGTADPINEPRFTYAYFRAARRPKYLLRLLGARHLPPYTSEQPQLSIVERTTIDFLDAYVGHSAPAFALLPSLATSPDVAALSAEP